MSDIGNITILLVDSDPKTLDRHAVCLQEMGLFNHLRAENGTEAVAMINNFKPDMVIANLSTPMVNGISLLRLVRQKGPPYRNTIFMLYGDKRTNIHLAQCGRMGVNSIIFRPYGNDFFKQKVHEALNPAKAPEDEEAERLFELCMEQIARGQLEEALITCQNILSIHDSAEVYYHMGYINALKGELDEAMKYFQRATIINRHHAQAFNQMGIVCQKLGRDEEAQKYLTSAADIYMDRHQDHEAEEVFSLILSIKPDTANVYNSLGIIYRRQHQLEESLKAYGKALKIHPEDEYIHFNLARTHLDLGDREQARKCLRRALEINPDFNTASELLRSTELGLEIIT